MWCSGSRADASSMASANSEPLRALEENTAHVYVGPAQNRWPHRFSLGEFLGYSCTESRSNANRRHVKTLGTTLNALGENDEC